VLQNFANASNSFKLIHNSHHFRDRYSGHYPPPPPYDKNLKSGKNFEGVRGKRKRKGKREGTKRGKGNRSKKKMVTIILLFSCLINALMTAKKGGHNIDPCII